MNFSAFRHVLLLLNMSSSPTRTNMGTSIVRSSFLENGRMPVTNLLSESFSLPRRYCSKKSSLILLVLLDKVDIVRGIRFSLEYITFIIFFNKAGLGGIHTKVWTGLNKITLFRFPVWCNAKSIASQPPREGPIK